MDIKEEWIAEMTEGNSKIWRTDIEGKSREEVIRNEMGMAKDYGLKSFRIGSR